MIYQNLKIRWDLVQKHVSEKQPGEEMVSKMRGEKPPCVQLTKDDKIRRAHRKLPVNWFLETGINITKMRRRRDAGASCKPIEQMKGSGGARSPQKEAVIGVP